MTTSKRGTEVKESAGEDVWRKVWLQLKVGSEGDGVTDLPQGITEAV